MLNFLVYTSLTSWDEVPRSRHQVSHELKTKGRVYFVEKSQVGAPRIEQIQVEENVVLIRPSYPIDYRVRYRTPLLNELYHKWLIRKIKQLDRSYEIVFTFDHTSYLLSKAFSNLVYYCGDDFIGIGKLNFLFTQQYHRYIEKRLAADSKMCVVTSNFLQSKFIDVNPNTHVIPLGAPTVEAGSVSYETKARETPVLGLVAFLNNRLPLDVIDELLQKFKVVFIGPTENPEIQKRYEANTNALFVGPKKGRDLQLTLQQVDVCIAPYNESTINKGLTPNKLWLYLSLGKPCVVTDIPNIRDWTFEDKVVYKTANKDFSATCMKAFLEDNEESFRKRVEASKANSWTQRVSQILELYYQD